MVTDPIADYLTRIRNAQMANHRIVEIPASNLKKRITEILYDKGYILKYKFEDVIGNKYLVEFKNIPVRKVGELSHVYELLYYVEDEGQYSVYKIVNVNPYRVLETVFGRILEDFAKR